MAIPISYNLRNLFQRPVSTLTTMVGFGLTVMIFIGALALASGFKAALKKSGSPDNAIVVRKGADSEISSGLSREATDIIRGGPEVATTPDGHGLTSADVVVLTNQPRLGQPGYSNLTVRGIDPSSLALRDQVRITDGRMFAPGSDEIIVGRRIAPRFAHCALGDKMRFGPRDFSVVGHCEAAGAAGESEVWGDNAVLMPVFRGEVFESVTFRMKDPGRFEQVRKTLEADPRLGVDVHRESDWYTQQAGVLATVIGIMGFFITLIMAVGAVFGAMNTMFAAVGSRTREIAVLQILGFSPFSVMVSFMIESLFLALMGGALGCLMALPINGIVTSTTNFTSFSEVAFAFRITWVGIAIGLIFAAGMGLAGGFLPSLAAASRPLAKSVREL